MPTLTVNSIAYNVQIRGSGPALVLLHGFTGSSQDWDVIAAQVESNFNVVSIDLLGHGQTESPPMPARYAMQTAAADLDALLARLKIVDASLLGYSMGGRLALYYALTYPQRLRRLILESASPGLKSTAERKSRRRQDELLATRIEREDVESFVDFWESIPLFASQSALPAQVRTLHRQRRLRNNPRGLANSLRGMGSGAQPSLWQRLPALHMPVLHIAGLLDEKFCAIQRQMDACMVDSTLKIVAGAGHTVHLERPDAFLEHVGEFLSL